MRIEDIKIKLPYMSGVVKMVTEPMRKLQRTLRLMFTEWPEIRDEELVQTPGDYWRYYSELLRADRNNWLILESHERWLRAEAKRAREEAEEEVDEELGRRLHLYANIYEFKLRTLRRLMHKYMATNTLSTWEQEQQSIEREDAGIHAPNRKWIASTYRSIRPNHRSDAAADEEVIRLYKEEYGMKLDETTIRRYTGRKRD